MSSSILSLLEPPQSEWRPVLGRKADEDRQMDALYTNDAFGDQGSTLAAASPAPPSRQRRLT